MGIDTGDAMRICVVTGGTGGHIYPALALVEALKDDDPNHSFLFMGNIDRMEASLIPAAGYPFVGLKTKGLQGNPLQQLYALVTLLLEQRVARKHLKAFNPDWVIGFGGYVCVPVILAAQRLGIQTLLHEQNAIVGKANRFLGRRVNAVAVSYATTLKDFPSASVRHVGNPRSYQFKTAPNRVELFETLKLEPSKPTVLWVMGSLGSQSLNAHLDTLIELFEQASIQFIVVSGPKHFNDLMSRIHERRHVRIVQQIDQVAWMQVVDLMITRGGATTASEIMMSGVPAIIIPSPYVPNNHQYHNAKVLLDAQAAVLLEEKDVEASSLMDLVKSLIDDKPRLHQMRLHALKLAKPNAAQDMIAWLKDVSTRTL
jgi:UDP-N-acetylglucosamine--N-acetylmuramyl-(pentapeptide) pyrophosphoryl-undecaprenol N-acetylglucosamine transferase